MAPANYAPGTLIDSRCLHICRAFPGKYRIVRMATDEGYPASLYQDYDSLQAALNDLDEATGGPYGPSESGQTMYKVYVFDDQGTVLADRGSL